MTQSDGLDDAQVIILAAQLTSESNFTQLQLLAAEHQNILIPDLLFRLLLTYLPIDVDDVANLASFLKHVDNNFANLSYIDDTLDTSSIHDLSAYNSRERLHGLRLGNDEERDQSDYDDGLCKFLIEWVHKAESIAGVSNTAVQLLEPFVVDRPKLMDWRNSYLVPLLKLQNDFYPSRADFLDIQTIETMHGSFGVKTLLQFAVQDRSKAQIGRDLNEVVAPWVYGASRSKRRRMDSLDSIDSSTSWQNVNEWIYDTSRSNFDLAAKLYLEWDGPKSREYQGNDSSLLEDSDLLSPYIQTGIALITTSTETGENINVALRQLLQRSASLATRIDSTSTDTTIQSLSNASRSDFLQNSILRPNNPITSPSKEVFNFLENCLSAQNTLQDFKLPSPLVVIVETAIFGSEDRQKQELLRILQQIPRLTRSDIGWPGVRQQIYTLRSGKEGSSHTKSAHTNTFLGRVPAAYIEQEFLDTLITNGHYAIVNDIYLNVSDSLLDRNDILKRIVSAIYAAYDNASNGNRTRGGMKRASDILKAFQPQFPSAPVFTQAEHLIRATHSLSFYHLTLEHGVPFQPATIRIHHDPVSLIVKVLEQNHKAYTKLDDLLEIGRNLAQAGLANFLDSDESSNSLDERLFETQHRITYLAITSALSDHDFNTAYSYITTRLSTSPSKISDSVFTDDTSWRAAYAAGKYRPSSSPKSIHERIIGLSKRMDLLSLALTLTPAPESLSEILATWRRCEEEMDSLKAQAVEEERVVDSRANHNSVLPGSFAEDREIDAVETRRIMERRALSGASTTYEEEAPMGLFDVARGAASAFRKSAFPLRSTSGQMNVKDQVEMNNESPRDSLDEGRPSGEYQRVRKRDMVSNMVTGGFVSGMSWVLGAPPPKTPDEK